MSVEKLKFNKQQQKEHLERMVTKLPKQILRQSKRSKECKMIKENLARYLKTEQANA